MEPVAEHVDITDRSWVPESGWPLATAEPQLYLKRAEAILALTSDLSSEIRRCVPALSHPKGTG